MSTRSQFKETPGLLRLWGGLLAGPTAFLSNLQINYMLATLACDDAVPWLHLTALATLALAGGGGALAWHEWRRTGGEWPGEAEGPVPRSRFMAMLGLLTSALFALVIVAQWIPVFILGPCAGS